MGGGGVQWPKPLGRGLRSGETWILFLLEPLTASARADEFCSKLVELVEHNASNQSVNVRHMFQRELAAQLGFELIDRGQAFSERV